MSEDPMPTFIDALEHRLRREAARGDATSGRRSARSLRIRIGLPVAATGLLVAAALVALPSGGGSTTHTPIVSVQPLILRTASAVDAGKILDEVQHAGSLKTVLGPDARMTEARPVPAFGGIAYVVTGDAGWCLLAPDPAVDPTGDPARRGAMTCLPTAVIQRYGIPLVVGHNGIAALPQGVPDPTIALPDGTVEHLQPTDQGIVTFEGRPSGSVLTLYARDGTTITLHVP